jgi:excisionase family DNA binding protein
MDDPMRPPKNAPEAPQLLTISETAKALGFSPRSKNSVYRLIASGALPAVTLPGGQRVDVEDLRKYIEANKRVAS